MGLLEALIIVLIYGAVIAVVAGVAIWAIRTMWPTAPAIIPNGVMVVAVLVFVLVLVRTFSAHLPALR